MPTPIAAEPQVTMTFGVSELQRIIHLADEARQRLNLSVTGAEATIVANLRQQLTAKLAK
jgi:hypothetical protein